MTIMNNSFWTDNADNKNAGDNNNNGNHNRHNKTHYSSPDFQCQIEYKRMPHDQMRLLSNSL